MDPDRFDRQMRMFGEEGQQRIEALSVGIVGCGGLGSHVVQQLAYLGIRDFVLIDDDVVDRTSLNRLVGASPEDVAVGEKKVAIGRRLIQRIQPEANVVVIDQAFTLGLGEQTLSSMDVIYGCLDNDRSRLVLNEFCQRQAKPYWDLATDVELDAGTVRFGGRILYSVHGETCLVCRGAVDQERLRREETSSLQQDEEAEIYGVPQVALGASGPAVVSLNGLIASAAVTEFMVDTVGIRDAIRHLEYLGTFGRLVVVSTPSAADCYFCAGLYGASIGAATRSRKRGRIGSSAPDKRELAQ